MASTRPVATSSTPRLSLSRKILIGLVAGAAVGLFFGEQAAALQIAADAYVRLLQMTVLPYIVVSVIGSIGTLDAAQALALGKRAGIVVLLLWIVALAMICLFPLMFPPHQSASFFSTALFEDREPFDFLNLYIPTNPFNSLANNIVPAVVLFSIVLGVALIGVPEKARLLDVLRIAGSAVAKATNFVVSLTPYGVFAIGAVFAGTLSLEDLQRLQVYLISYIGISLLLAAWVLPGLVAALTPVPYRALVSRTKDALVMAFMTTSLFAVLPLLTEGAKQLIREHASPDETAAAATDAIVPASFNLPHTGKLLSLSFVLFAAWFADTRIDISAYPQLAAMGLLTMFGSVNAAIPFLLDLFRIPADTFQLFLASGVINARFGTLVAAVHTVVVAVLGTCAVTGTLRFDARKITRFAVITLLLTAGTVGGTRFLLGSVLNRPYEKDLMLTSMGMLRDRGPAQVYKSASDATPLPAVTTSVLDRVTSRRALRVGFFGDSLPYAFFNARDELVGFDVEMAHQLARDLGVSLELVQIRRSDIAKGLDPAQCDLIMSGAVVTADGAESVLYSSSYLDETIAFVVPDHRAAAFSEWAQVRAMRPLRVGVPQEPYFMQKVRDELPDAEIVPVARIEDMFGAQALQVDAFVLTAERGSAYTLLHPEYSVAVPKPRPFKLPLAYVIAGRDVALASVVNTWIELKRRDGTSDELFSHWILGQGTEKKQPRWSIVRDVLHWTR